MGGLISLLDSSSGFVSSLKMEGEGHHQADKQGSRQADEQTGELDCTPIDSPKTWLVLLVFMHDTVHQQPTAALAQNVSRPCL